MYVATFYSFKGGVGRTLALVNVGVALAQQGHRVLMVDFDLEAPGLSSFDICRDCRDKPGIIDFVLHYIEHDETPDIANYITECAIGDSNRGGLFVMPAGRTDDAYGKRLAQVDWTALYRKEDGFLMIEDMKQQWATSLRPDYVLVDSRTGHTEESGICTRQLADAVVVMFFPNEQNLVGLRKIVGDIRAEAEAQHRDVSLHFVTSNVLDLDDEEGILQEGMERFKKELQFENAQTVHHYPSHALLHQQIFTLKRPRSRLAEEYRNLAETIIEQNPADRKGALSILRKLTTREAELPRTESERDLFQAKLQSVLSMHPHDGEIATSAAMAYVRLGQVKNAKTLLDAAVADGYDRVEVFRERFRVGMLLSQPEAATEDLVRSLNAEGSTSSQTIFVFGVLAELRPDLLARAMDSRAFQALSADERWLIANNLLDEPEAIPFAERIFRQLTEAQTERPFGRVGLTLSLIRLRKFSEVVDLLGPRERLLGDAVEVPDIFNFAMAEWGASGKVPMDLLRHFIAVVGKEADEDEDDQDANSYQCYALACWLIGDVARAKSYVLKARNRIKSTFRPTTFSAWRYLAIPKDEFLKDLSAIEQALNGEPLRPAFLDRTPETVH